MSEKTLAERIVIDPEIRFGKPRIKGTRVTVGDLLRALGAGDTMDELVEDVPDITREDILAALAYAGENIDRLVVASQ